jgi:hypothetical protein
MRSNCILIFFLSAQKEGFRTFHVYTYSNLNLAFNCSILFLIQIKIDWKNISGFRILDFVCLGYTARYTSILFTIKVFSPANNSLPRSVVSIYLSGKLKRMTITESFVVLFECSYGFILCELVSLNRDRSELYGKQDTSISFTTIYFSCSNLSLVSL